MAKKIPKPCCDGKWLRKIAAQLRNWLILESLLREDTKTLLPSRTLLGSVSGRMSSLVAQRINYGTRRLQTLLWMQVHRLCRRLSGGVLLRR